MLMTAARPYDRLAEPPVPDPRMMDIATFGMNSSRGQEAFTALHGFYDPSVAAICRRIIYPTHLPDRFHSVENVRQDTWLHALVVLGEGRFEVEEPVMPWLGQIARRRCFDVMRAYGLDPKRPVKVFLPEQPVIDVAHAMAGQDGDPHLLLETLDLMRALPPEQRLAVFADGLLGESNPELAARLGVPLGTLKSRIRMGSRTLRTLRNEADGVTTEAAT